MMGGLVDGEQHTIIKLTTRVFLQIFITLKLFTSMKKLTSSSHQQQNLEHSRPRLADSNYFIRNSVYLLLLRKDSPFVSMQHSSTKKNSMRNSNEYCAYVHIKRKDAQKYNLQIRSTPEDGIPSDQSRRLK